MWQCKKKKLLGRENKIKNFERLFFFLFLFLQDKYKA